MNLGQRLFELRKAKNLSQEEVADKLNVTRQTVSKWETDQSTPDFDKIAPLCELYNVTADQLINNTEVAKETIVINNDNKIKKAKGLCIGIFLYFVAIAWIMTSIPLSIVPPVLGTAIFLLICGVATGVIIYTCMVYKTHEKKETKEEKEENIIVKQINNIISIVILVIYLVISFTTMAWHITWILWVVCGLLEQIVKLIFMLKEGNNEK